MKYRLAVYKGKDFFEPTGYMSSSMNKSGNENSLEDICEFTSQFLDTEDLMTVMLNIGVVPTSYCNGEFAINFYRKKDDLKPKKLDYGVTFLDDKKFFNSANGHLDLRIYFINNIESDEFYQKFEDRYGNLNDVPFFSADLNGIRACHITKKERGYSNQEYYNAIYKFVRNYTTYRDKNGKYKTRFSTLRDLAMFAADDERSKKPKPTNTYQDKKYWLDLKTRLEHYRELLREEALPDEEYNAYSHAVNECERKLSLIKKSDILE